jgi:hypothetical protein
MPDLQLNISRLNVFDKFFLDRQKFNAKQLVFQNPFKNLDIKESLIVLPSGENRKPGWKGFLQLEGYTED